MGRKVTNLQPDNESLCLLNRISAKKVKLETIDFSFYYATKIEMQYRIKIEIARNLGRRKNTHVCKSMQYGIRVEIAWNPLKMTQLDTLELHGKYVYNIRNPRKQNNVNAELLNKAREFFKKYKVLFAAVWECVLEPNILAFYLYQYINFKELLSEFTLNENELSLIENADNLSDLEAIVREHKIFNING